MSSPPLLKDVRTITIGALLVVAGGGYALFGGGHADSSGRAETDRSTANSATSATVGSPAAEEGAATMVPKCPAGMSGIPGGTYTPAKGGQEAKIAGFCLDVTEVTVKSYGACVTEGSCTEPDAFVNKRLKIFCNWKSPGRQQHPVNCVDWTQSASFCSSLGKRLPTEEEWEWAARNGDQGTTYPWGEEEPDGDRANACGPECGKNFAIKAGLNLPTLGFDDGWPETAPVGSFPKGANRWGVQDLAGNVCEWTGSKAGASALTGLGGADRVYRGGGWDPYVLWEAFSSDARGSRPPTDRESYLGFRCARSDG